MTRKKHIRIVSLKPDKDLAEMKELSEAAKIVPVIEGLYNLTEVPEAPRYFGEGFHKGRVVIDLANWVFHGRMHATTVTRPGPDGPPHSARARAPPPFPSHILSVQENLK